MWKYKGKVISEISDMPEDTVGFVYKVTHKPTGKHYIGKKVLYFNRTLPPLKGKKRRRRVTKESDWKVYHGSNKEIMKMIKEGRNDEFTREILVFVTKKKLLTYYETKFLFTEGVLEHPDKFFNDNILGKFYTGDLQKG